MSGRIFIAMCLGSIVLSSCGNKSDDGGGGTANSSDVSAVSAAEFDPVKAAQLDQPSATKEANSIHQPTALGFESVAGLSLTLSEQRTSFDLSSTGLSSCIDNTPFSVNTVTASGASVTQIGTADFSPCYKDALSALGATDTSATCGLSLDLSLTCPGKDYSAANGKKISEAQASLGNGMATCKLPAGISGTEMVRLSMTCVVTATLNGKAVSVNTKLHAAQMGTNNKPCEFTTVGNQNVLADCVEGENVVNNGTSINGTTVNENFVYRFNLTGAKQTLGSINFSAGQVFPFAVNNWSGQITTTAAAAGYNLKSSSGTITGSLRP